MNEVKSFEFYLCILLYMYFFLFIVILFINCETCFYEFNVFSLDFWTDQTVLKLTHCNLHHHLVLLKLAIFLGATIDESLGG